MNKSHSAARKQLTVFVCDLVGSTKMSQRLDIEDYANLLKHYQDCVVAKLEKWGGYVAEYKGDAIWGYFGYPQTNEKSVDCAILAAIDVMDVFKETTPNGKVLQVRISIDTGLCLIDEGKASGLTPNRADRLNKLAEPGSVVVADSTYLLAKDSFEFEDLQFHELKGIEGKVRAWRVIKQISEISRYKALHTECISQLVDRLPELTELHSDWKQACHGIGKVVHIFGEPGIGKSRIVAAMATDIEQKYPCWYFYCSYQLQGSAFVPVSTNLRLIADIQEEDDVKTQLKKLGKTFSIKQGDTLSLIARLLSIKYEIGYRPSSMSPLRSRERLFEVLIGLVKQACKKQPLLIVLEDYHWADPSTKELIERLAIIVKELPILIIVTSRYKKGDSLFKVEMPEQRAVKLDQLKNIDCYALISLVSKDNDLPKNIQEKIVDKTDGVPLFIEEVTHSIIHSLNSQESNSANQAFYEYISIPTRLQDHLMSRIDQLGEAKYILQIGSIAGREFFSSMIKSLANYSSEEFEYHNQILTDSGLVTISTDKDDATYIFKHAMVQDAAYNSLLKTQRKKLHHQVGEWFQSEQPETSMIRPELIAYHYELAGEIKSAATYWLKAGKLSTSRLGFVEAIEHLNKAKKLLFSQSETVRDQMELDIILTLGAAYAGTGGYSGVDTGKAYGRAMELCIKLNYPAETFPVYSGAASYQMMRGNYANAQEIATQCLEFADVNSNPIGKVIGNRVLGAAYFLTGQFERGIGALNSSIQLYNKKPKNYRGYALGYALDHKTIAFCYLTMATLVEGSIDKALHIANRNVAHSNQIGRHSINFSINFKAALHLIREDAPELTLEVVNSCVDMALKEGYVQFLGSGRAIMGEAIMSLGRIDEGLSLIEQGVSEYENMNAILFLPFTKSILAKGYLAAHRPQEAYTVLKEAEEITKKTKEIWYLPEIQRLLAESLVQQNLYKQAYATYQESLKLADQLKARFWTFKIAYSFAQKMNSSEYSEEAYELLRKTNELLDEGCELPIRIASKKLLEKLGTESDTT